MISAFIIRLFAFDTVFQFQDLSSRVGCRCDAVCWTEKHHCKASRSVNSGAHLRSRMPTSKSFFSVALASQSLSIIISLTPYIREFVRRHLNPKQAVVLIEFDKLKRVRSAMCMTRSSSDYLSLTGLPGTSV